MFNRLLLILSITFFLLSVSLSARNNSTGCIHENFGRAYHSEIGNYASTTDPGSYNGDIRLAFSAEKGFLLDSVTVYYDGDWSGPNDNITFTLYDASMNVISNSNALITSSGKNRLHINLEISGAGNYFLGFSAPQSSQPNDWKNAIWHENRPWSADGSTNYNYPYTVNETISITHAVAESESNFGTALYNFYPGFYDLKINTNEECSSPSISLLNPSNNDDIIVNSETTLNSSVSDSDGYVSNVKYIIKQDTTTINTYSISNTASSWEVIWIPTTTGVYTIEAIATDDMGLTTSTKNTIFVTNPLGVNTTIENQPQIIPNPSSNDFHIQYDGHFDYELYDISGVLIEKNSANSKTQLGHNLDSGIYILRIFAKNEYSSVKLVKK